MNNKEKILDEILVELFNHILYLEEQNIQSKGINLTMNEVHTIEAIRDVEDPIMSNVARKLMITLGTLTTVIKRLEHKGYVKRIRDKQDARILRLELSTNATNVLKIHDGFHRNMIETILNDLNDEEEDVLLTSLVKIKEYFKSKWNRR
ncbi:MAG: MarR family transcriptional regulator [Bacilli bacterium]|jgi:DNA-binding MarR family transcriptional regulator|nr:MarR family transcriptional regulator [Bacilli bacterium]